MLMVTGDNGIFKNAKNARDNTEKSSVKEEVSVEYRNAILKNIKDGSNVQNILEATLKAQDSTATVVGSSEYNMTINYKGYQFQIKNGEIEVED